MLVEFTNNTREVFSFMQIFFFALTIFFGPNRPSSSDMGEVQKWRRIPINLQCQYKYENLFLKLDRKRLNSMYSLKLKIKFKIDKYLLHSKNKNSTKYREIFKWWFQGRKDTFSNISPCPLTLLFCLKIKPLNFPPKIVLFTKKIFKKFTIWDYNRNTRI